MKKYDAITKNLLKQLAKGKEVMYGSFILNIREEKLIVTGDEKGKKVEWHYKLKSGENSGLSLKQFRDIFAFREKPMFTVAVKK